MIGHLQSLKLLYRRRLEIQVLFVLVNKALLVEEIYCTLITYRHDSNTLYQMWFRAQSISSYCQLCREPLIFACTSCEYITEEKVHIDCRNAEVLAKTAATTEEGAATAATATTPTSTTGNQQESVVDKPKEEIDKAELSSVPSYMTTKQGNDKNNNINPFAADTAAWQRLITYWLSAYGEFLKNAPKMTEE